SSEETSSSRYPRYQRRHRDLRYALLVPSKRSTHTIDRTNTIFDALFACCNTLGGRFENLYQRVEQASMNQGLLESLAGVHQKIRDLEAKQAVLEQRLALLERAAAVKIDNDGYIKKEVKQEPDN
ncbi:hypothetical protein KCU89_g7297, partial [Aureobasidium melanogenum]